MKERFRMFATVAVYAATLFGATALIVPTEALGRTLECRIVRCESCNCWGNICRCKNCQVSCGFLL